MARIAPRLRMIRTKKASDLDSVIRLFTYVSKQH